MIRPKHSFDSVVADLVAGLEDESLGLSDSSPATPAATPVPMTSYLVRCPYPDCRWHGSLMPMGTAPSSQPGLKPQIMFRCPKCKREIRSVADDMKPGFNAVPSLAPEQTEAELP